MLSTKAGVVARRIRLLWLVAILASALAAWGSVHLFAARIGPLAAALLGVFAVCALHPLVLAVDFALSRIAGDPVPPTFRLSAWGAIRMFDAELDASMRGFWFATPFRFRRAAAAPAAGTPLRSIPLLFIHGYFCNRAVWLSFMQDAAARGYVCEAITLVDPFASIDSHADAVDAAIDALLADARRRGADAPQVAIVGHSMGGLVARAALPRIDATRVARVVSIGTPHRGTVMARFGRSPCVVQMRPGSAWLAALESREAAARANSEDGPDDRWYALYTHHDQMVFPQTGVLSEARSVAIGGCGHVALLYDRRVRRLVFDALEHIDTDAADGTRTEPADVAQAATGGAS